MTKERSRGEAHHRREAIAGARREGVIFPDLKHQLNEVEVQLSHGNNEMDPAARASLQIRGIWLRDRLGEITDEMRIQSIEGVLTEVERDHPEAYQKLTTPNKDGVSPVAQIRDSISKIAGYYTKRP